LSGIRALDLSKILAEPFCTMMLGDQGAEILKVKRPGSGDGTGTWGSPFDGRRATSSESAARANCAHDARMGRGSAWFRPMRSDRCVGKFCRIRYVLD